MATDPDVLKRVAARVKELAAGYEPPTFEEVPHPDAALFLAAIDHQTGYTKPHEVDGEGPYDGSALLWALGLRAERRAPGALTARSIRPFSFIVYWTKHDSAQDRLRLSGRPPLSGR